MSKQTLLLPVAFGLLSACGGGLVNTKAGGEDTANEDGIPKIYVEVSSVAFGELRLGATGSETLNIQNVGSASLVLEDLTFSESAFFATAGAGLEIGPGMTTALGLRYLPLDYSADNATLTLFTNDPDTPELVVTLTGSVVTDGDGDGYDSEEAGGDDCDDEDPDVHPAAFDEWYDGADANCDGADDYDQDGDGYQVLQYNEDPITGGDCQDANPAINPAAADSWYDGVDSDCDGSDDYDQDGDGWRSEAHGQGSDCDDLDSSVNPDGFEVFNAKDDDCDGVADVGVPGWSSDLVFTGRAGGDLAGNAITMGDLNADGAAELIIGASYYNSRGAVAVFESGSLTSDGDIADGDNFIQAANSGDYFGRSVAYLSNVGTDGEAGLVVGAPYYSGSTGIVYVIPGPEAAGGGSVSHATLTVSGGSTGAYYVGMGMAQDLDMDGDGVEELFGYYQTTTSLPSTAYMWLLYGDTSGDLTMDDVEGKYYANGNGGQMYSSFATGGDLDGDGYDDAIYCDHLADITATNDGGVWGLFGAAEREDTLGTAESMGTAATVLTNGSNYERHGWICAIGDDLDGDGDDELWVYNAGTTDLYVLPGGDDMRDGSLDPADNAMLIYDLGSTDPTPAQLRSIGDWDGDGVSEMAMGLDPTSSRAGQVWVYSSQDESGTIGAEEGAFATIEGDGDTDEGHYQTYFGAAISTLPGDLNGDGTDDFVVGDYGWGDATAGESQMGAVYISFNGSL